MDFIVLGGVLGAVMMVAGTILRDLVPRRLRITGDDSPWVDVRDRRRTVRSALAGGRLVTISGAVVLFVTALLVVLDVPDAVALAVVIGLTLAGLIASVGWLLWFRYQEPSGAIHRRQLQAIAMRLGPTRSPADSPGRSRVRDDRSAHGPAGRPAGLQDRDARHGTTRGQGRPSRGSRIGVEYGQGPPRREAQQDRPGRRSSDVPARRETPADHHPIAPQHDRSESPRPPSRNPHRRPAPQVARQERPLRGPAPSARSNESASRPTGNAPRS